jgi:hypothetical protein
MKPMGSTSVLLVVSDLETRESIPNVPILVSFDIAGEKNIRTNNDGQVYIDVKNGDNF